MARHLQTQLPARPVSLAQAYRADHGLAKGHRPCSWYWPWYQRPRVRLFPDASRPLTADKSVLVKLRFRPPVRLDHPLLTGVQVPPRTPKPGKFPAKQTILEHAAPAFLAGGGHYRPAH